MRPSGVRVGGLLERCASGDVKAVEGNHPVGRSRPCAIVGTRARRLSGVRVSLNVLDKGSQCHYAEIQRVVCPTETGDSLRLVGGGLWR